jgi:hypothetical protein
MRRLRLLRTLSLVLALLHLLVPPLVVVADARVEQEAARSGRAIVHVESHGSPTCPRVHPTDCALCQVVATVAAPPRASCPIPATTVALLAPLAARLGRPASGQFTLALPRAPPIG